VSNRLLKCGVWSRIAGNKYRIVVWINYPYRVVYVRLIGTHRQYDEVDAQNRLKAVVMNIMHCRTWSEISLVGPGG